MKANNIEAMKLALEGAANYIDALGGDSRKYRQVLANEALDKKAENARELGLDYEPAQQEPVAWGIIASNTGRICQVELDADEVEGHNPKHIVPLYTSPPRVKSNLKQVIELYDSPEQPAQQEPVAWMNILEDGYKCLTHNPIPNWTPLYTSPPAQQDIQRLSALVRAQQITIDKLEAQRTWVGLSDLNIDELENNYMKSAQTAHEFLRAIEAKLKEKNT